MSGLGAALVIVAMIGISAGAWYWAGRRVISKIKGASRLARRAASIPLAVGVCVLVEGLALVALTRAGWLAMMPIGCVSLLLVSHGVGALQRARIQQTYAEQSGPWPV